MRMWMVEPRLMCRKHLLGEHVELHMLVGSLQRGRSIAGFLSRGLLEPQHIRERHDVLVAEMTRRGYTHNSALAEYQTEITCKVDGQKSLQDLSGRCSECARRIKVQGGWGDVSDSF